MRHLLLIDQSKAYKDGNHLGCWASGGGVAIASIIHASETIGGGEAGTIRDAISNADSDWLNFIKTGESKEDRRKSRPSLMTGERASNPDSDILDRLDHWIKRGSGYLRIDFDTHSDVYIVMLDGYNKDIDKVIQQGFAKDILKAIKNTFDSPKKLNEK